MESGIYKIENIINGKLYVGSTNNYIGRRNTHICELKNNKHVNRHLQSAWNKFKENNFIRRYRCNLYIFRD